MENYKIISSTNYDQARKEIKKEKRLNENIKVIFSSNNDDLNRKILEKENIDILLLNVSKRKDFQKQRNSGFNQVMAKIAKKKNIVIGINLDEILNPNVRGKEKAEILSRVKQNIKLCKKYKLKMKFIPLSENKKNKKDIYDLKSLGLVLGMPTWMTKKL